MRNLVNLFNSQEDKSRPIDPLEVTTDHERRKGFLRYINRAWLILGIVTVVSLPLFPEQRGEFLYLIAVTFPTYLIVRFLNFSGRIRLAGVIFTLSVNFGFYGLFMVLAAEMGASQAFSTQTTVWLLMGLAVLFAGAFVDKWAAPILAGLNSVLLIATRLAIAPQAEPRPSALVFWWMMALTIWLYEGTLHEALRRTRAEVTVRKRAEEEIRRRLGELQTLYETSNAISAEHDLNTLLRAIVENAKKLLDSASSGMYLFQAASEELELTVDTKPYIPFGSRLRFGEGVAGRVALTRQPLRVDDYSTWEGRSPLYEGTSIRAVVEVPMLYKGELIGVLTAEEFGQSERKFTEAEEHLLSLFASQAAGAIHSARLREETANRLRELGLLYESGLALVQLANPKIIAQKIINLLDQKMDWHHTTIRLYHQEDETLELLAFNQPGLNDEGERGSVEERFRAAVARPGQGLSGWVVQYSEVVRSDDLKNDPRYFDTFPGLQSGLYVPMKIGERVIGVISIESEKPDAFSDSDERLTITLATQAAIAIQNAQLLNDLQQSNTDLTSAYDATIEGWSRAMDLRDKETEGHTLRVTQLTLSMARAMGFKEEELTQIRRGGLLHDIGKLGVPDGILLKNENLTEAEWEIMRKHPTYAFEMLSSISYLKPALDIPYCHHEKWAGNGYPRGLKGEQIPLAARIFAVVDVWDAVTSDRPYRPAWTREQALEYIREQSGKYFDPKVVETFFKLIADT